MPWPKRWRGIAWRARRTRATPTARRSSPWRPARRLVCTKMMRRLAPYAVAVGGAIVVTGAIGAVNAAARVSGLSAVYLLLVLWLGAQWGRGPAVAGSVAAF